LPRNKIRCFLNFTDFTLDEARIHPLGFILKSLKFSTAPDDGEIQAGRPHGQHLSVALTEDGV